MAQPRPTEMPKIIALLAAIGLVLIFVAYNLLGGSRPAETPPNTSGVPAITTSTQPAPATTGGSNNTPTGATATASDPMVVTAKPGQVRQFDETLDADPGGTYPPVNIGMTRLNTFEKFKEKPDPQPIAAKPTGAGTRNPIASVNGGGLPNYDGSGMTKPQELITHPVVDNTPQQEITLDGVVTGSDGFAVLTIREPGRTNTAIPDQKRFPRLGEMVGNQKIVEITELGLKLSKTEDIWSVGDKRGVTRRNTIVRITQLAGRTSMPAMDAKLPLISTP